MGFDVQHFPLLCLLLMLMMDNSYSQDYSVVRGKIDTMVGEVLSCKTDISGMTISIVKEGEPVLEKGYGVANRATGRPANADTMFGIASLSKAFTSTLLMKIIDRLDDVTRNTVVTKILKDFAFSDVERNKYATVQDLMSHRLGLPSYNNIRMRNLTRAEVARMFSVMKPKGEFRSSFHYNNIVYGLLTYITEELGDESWENLMMKEIFEPLEMNRTSFGHTVDLDDPNVALGYTLGPDGREFMQVSREMTKLWGSLGGSGSILASARDMSKWMYLHLNQGQNRNGQQVVQKTTISENFKTRVPMRSSMNSIIQVPDFPVTYVITGYGSAWMNGFYRGIPIITHTGSTFGYKAKLVLYPENNLGIFIALNGDDAKVHTRLMLETYIADLMLGYDPWLDVPSACTFPEPWKSYRPSSDSPLNKDRSPTKPLELYLGKYSAPVFGSLEITTDHELNCTNCLQMTYGVTKWILYPGILPNFFTARGTGMMTFWNQFSLIFKVPKGDNPKAESVVIPSFDSSDPPRFQRATNRCTMDCESTDQDTGGAVSTTLSWLSSTCALLLSFAL